MAKRLGIADDYFGIHGTSHAGHVYVYFRTQTNGKARRAMLDWLCKIARTTTTVPATTTGGDDAA
ncbi:MAG: hypothetical protein WDN10_03450 [bacterium]